MSFNGFITNEAKNRLKERFYTLLKDSEQFDCLVGYFYLSGFNELYKKLEHVDKVRILIGINTEHSVVKYVKDTKEKINNENDPMSDASVKSKISNTALQEMDCIDESYDVENGINIFKNWLKNGKLEIKACQTKNVHAKVYIATFKEGDRDIGRVITGSSNLTHSGLTSNIEFNVELTNPSDYKFAKDKFEELWQDATDVARSYKTVLDKSYIQPVTPYKLYLKLLYEYFQNELSDNTELFETSLPDNFMQLEYQKQAVMSAKKILEEYGGVFISDVVGLGKTYIATMLAGQLTGRGRTLVIAPPALINKNNQGSWYMAFSDFKIHADFKSTGKLKDLSRHDFDKYQNIIIDEAHHFRNTKTISYEQLSSICRGKRVILVTATPYNNTPKDILSLIKLFQSPHKSAIPNLPNIEKFFNDLEKRLKNLDRQEDRDKYLFVVKKNAEEIREKVLKYLMIRRTRSEIVKYYGKDLKKQKLKFPEVAVPTPLYYVLNAKENEIFMKTIKFIAAELKYARYTPLLYAYDVTKDERVGQQNMGKFMKTLLVKRLESSFHAFKLTVGRFVKSNKQFIEQYNNGYIYISKKHMGKIFDMLNEGDEEGIQELLDNDKAERKNASDFNKNLINDLKADQVIFDEIQSMWEEIDHDPKLERILGQLSKDRVLKNKLIIFTESKETAKYLYDKLLNNKYNPILYHGSATTSVRDEVLANFDARSYTHKNEHQILITTDALAEGVNLHRANVVINYDIPWNPTRMMQRVGRINRVDTDFDKIYTYNFFPTEEADNEIKLQALAESKIEAFLTLLGDDAALLTEGEPVGSHELFGILTKSASEEDEENSELKYLMLIKSIRDHNPALFEEIKRLPRKARSSKHGINNHLITYFRKGKIQKFFSCDTYHTAQSYHERELGFVKTAELFECDENTALLPIPDDYYDLRDENWQAFINATTEDEILSSASPSAKTLMKYINFALKNTSQLTDEQEDYLKCIKEVLKKGDIGTLLPKISTAMNALKTPTSLIIVELLKALIPDNFLKKHFIAERYQPNATREVVLSMYIKG